MGLLCYVSAGLSLIAILGWSYTCYLLIMARAKPEREDASMRGFTPEEAEGYQEFLDEEVFGN